MAVSVLSWRTAVFCRSLKGISSSKAVIPVHSLLQTASYNPKPLRLNLRDPYIPDKNSEKTPEWQRTARYDGKLFGRYGSASGIEPASLWPSHEQLDRVVAEENEWHPPIEVMLKNIKAKQREETEKCLAKEKLIAANMAKMPKMIADWRREKRESKLKLKEERSRREMLLAEAKARFGFAVDPRSPKFLQMVAEIEKEEKKKRKIMKRRVREEQRGATAPVTPPAASS
ncbi:growth arrest and DNA damage-inducible proteins-interacting protein 1 [Scomber scombrus]